MPLFKKHHRPVAPPKYRQPPAPQPTGPGVDGVAERSQTRLSEMEGRIFQLEEQLARAKREMNKCRRGSSSYNTYKRRATQIIKQKRTLERQAGNVSNLNFNMEQVKNASGSIKDAKESSRLLVEQSKALRQEMKGVNLDRVDDNQDDMQDLLQDADDIGEILGRTYNTDDIDDTELEAELDGIDETELFDDPSGSVPSYLKQQSLPGAPTSFPSSPTPGTSAHSLEPPLPAYRNQNQR